MEQAIRTLVLFALAGAGVSVAAWLVAWRLDARRKLARALKRVLGREPDALALSPHQGRALGLDVEGGGLATLWDAGASGLVYRLEELDGAEMIVDGEVRARVYRDEPARALDRLDPLAERVTLRLVFDTPRWPEFELDLLDQPGAGEEAMREGRRWLAQIGALLKRTPRRTAPEPKPPPITEPDDEDGEDYGEPPF
jgi:hypothetical protein